MPKRTDISSILIIGAGPIIIGQACEFDYSGTQACRALRNEGYRIILVNSNPATIMTDPSIADATYIEPVTAEYVEKVIEKERPDAILPTMGGQTALNIALELDAKNVLAKYQVELIGADKDAIAKAEDRQLFRKAMDKIGLESPASHLVNSISDANKALDKIGLPAIIRPSFTLGGTGGGIAYNRQEFEQIVTGGIDASPVGEVLVEESVLGWKEYEMEVVRDRHDNAIIICSIENIDPMGVHTGDSITVAPAQTLTDKEFQIMRDASIAVLREIGVETGGSNVQFAVNPENGRMVVIEMNPRVSRSSALASKATGFPIAKVAALLAVGYTLDELSNEITGATPASFEPTLDYVVTKIPRFAFEKFPGSDDALTTSMKSVGEAMAIGRSFNESFLKALCSLETGLDGLTTPKIHNLGQGDDRNTLLASLAVPTPERILAVGEALRYGLSVQEIHQVSKIDPWFLRQFEQIIDAERILQENGLPADHQTLQKFKSMGFSDARIASLVNQTEEEVRRHRHAFDVRPSFRRIDTCAAEFPARTPYMYSAYEPLGHWEDSCEAAVTDLKKIIILGGGPNRIGQGIEFDYCCCHAAMALSADGYETIMINCNPETVSTDYDTSDRLYFEPLTIENVLEIIDREQAQGTVLGVIVQFGGQTPLKLAEGLEKAGVTILGTSPDMIDLAEDRERFKDLLERIGLQQPKNGIARSRSEALAIADQLNYPLVIRPSYVLGGRAMEIVRDEEHLHRYIDEAVVVSGSSPILLDSYLDHAIEVDVDAISDGETVHVAGIMEHIEEAGIHSGDSACSLPPFSLSQDVIDELKQQTIDLAIALEVKGLMNIQFAIKEINGKQEIFILEVNPRASRTVPFVAKAIGRPLPAIASQVMAGQKLDSLYQPPGKLKHVAVKEAVLPFARFPQTDVILGPEMRSTGEVMGIGPSFEEAFLKSQQGAGNMLPHEGSVFLSVRDEDKQDLLETAQLLHQAGFRLIATGGTRLFLTSHGIPVDHVNKVLEGRPHIVDHIKNGDVQLVINTTDGAQALADSFSIRRSTVLMKVPYFTTIRSALIASRAIVAQKDQGVEVCPLQQYV
ncbi:MAG: carbamoyl-phosphate synthase large subunit [Alphaproteobacteria bacterium]|nr:carbamoyl-phosphate synthase large subunit [Alphaproteobacteria bacterium]